MTILLDTHALLWLQAGHKRSRTLERASPGSLYVSPASLFELQLLVEVGRIAPRRGGGGVAGISDDPRWCIDDPPSVPWFARAASLSWTREPFDRLIAAHALLRGWRLATADAVLLEHLGQQATIEL